MTDPSVAQGPAAPPASGARSTLGTRTWPTVASDPRRPPLLVVPIGSCEQHGEHLPLDTDTRIAVALASRLAEHAVSLWPSTRGELLVAPPLAITASGEHAAFPGTLSVGTEVMADILVELVRSADWASGVVFVNGHGGNATAVRRAVVTCTADGRRVLAWWPRVAGADAHAGHTETSLMLAIDPSTVQFDRATPGRREHVTELIDDLRRDGVRAVSPNGVLGDPTAATASHGHSLMARLVADLVSTVDEWWTPLP
jgi:mycofactocin precursor peptide peptidase